MIPAQGADTFDSDQADTLWEARQSLDDALSLLQIFLNGYGLTVDPSEDDDLGVELKKVVDPARTLVILIEEFRPVVKDFVEDLNGPIHEPEPEPFAHDAPNLYDEWSYDGPDPLDQYDASPYSEAARRAAFGLDEPDEPEEHDFRAANEAILAQLSGEADEHREERENELNDLMKGLSGGIALT